MSANCAPWRPRRILACRFDMGCKAAFCHGRCQDVKARFGSHGRSWQIHYRSKAPGAVRVYETLASIHEREIQLSPPDTTEGDNTAGSDHPGYIALRRYAICRQNPQPGAGCDESPDARADERIPIQSCVPPAAQVFGLPASSRAFVDPGHWIGAASLARSCAALKWNMTAEAPARSAL